MCDFPKNIPFQLLKVQEVAKILNISRAMAYRLIQTGEIRAVKIGSALRVRCEDLINYIEENISPAFS